jgi:hypothetical protein
MKNFYLTFGHKSPFRDGYVLIVADDEESAREEVFYVFGQYWSNLYSEENFRPEFFPAGQFGKTLEASSRV